MNTPLPQQFLDTIAAQMPAHLSITDLINACNEPLRFSIRVNTLKIRESAFIDLMTPKGWRFEPIPWCEQGFWVNIDNPETIPGKLPEHLLGMFYIQEASSMLPPVALFNAINSKETFNQILDLAAAPGSKTTQIAALMDNKGLLVANEYSSSRIKALHSNLARLGVNNTLISHFDGSVHGDYLENQFDAVLLDAPCSGEGTVRKDPDAFKNWSLEHIEEITKVQKGLIVSAFKALKPGGTLVYSTCALNFDENQGVCQHLLDTFPGQVAAVDLKDLFINAGEAVTAEGYLHIWPQIYNSEGFFIAKFTKLVATSDSTNPTFRSKFPFTPLSKKEFASTMALLQTKLDASSIHSENLFKKDQEVWYFPDSSEQLTSQMRFVRHGIKLLDIKPKQQIITHEAYCNFGIYQHELSRSEVTEYLKGRDLAIENEHQLKGEVLLGYQGRCVGLGKWVNNKVKNKLPRSLVNDHVECY